MTNHRILLDSKQIPHCILPRGNKLIVIFSGYNQRAVISFLRTLKRVDLPFCIIACSKSDGIFETQYASNVVDIRSEQSLQLADILRTLEGIRAKSRASKCMIAPTSEALNRFFLLHRECIEQMGFEIPLVEESLYAKVSDKWAFRTLCQQNRIAIPHEYMSLECAEFPCVAKPRAYFSSVDNRTLDPHILHTRVDLNSFLEYQIESDFYYQRFIEGPSYYLLYYFFKNGTVQKYSQQNLLQQPGGKSIVAAVSSDIHCARVSLQFEELFSSIGFTGLVMVEIKGDDRNLCMIEANPRFWGPSQLFVDAGVNLFEALLLDHGYLHELAPIKTTPNKTRYFWFGGIVLTWKSGMPLAHHTNSDINLHTLISELPKWLRSDVYRRSDTYGYFVSEIIAS